MTDSCRYVLGNGLCGNFKQYERAYCDEHMKSLHTVIGVAQPKIEGHLSSNNMSYIEHWRGALMMSMALFIHAFFPNKLDHYVSDRLNSHER